MKKLILILSIVYSSFAYSGVIELGGSASFRNSQLDSDNYQKTESYTGSLSYYFWEMSALEFSYTKGQSTLSTKASGEDRIIYKTDFEMMGVDLVFTFAPRKATFQPFIKAGGATVSKKVYRELIDGSVTKIGETSGSSLVPSVGLGFKLKLTQTMGIKGSYDMWQSATSDDSEKWDTAWRLGISWLF